MFRWIGIVLVIVLLLFFYCHTAIKCAEIRQLPFCDDSPDEEKIDKNPARRYKSNMYFSRFLTKKKVQLFFNFNSATYIHK